MIEKGIYLILRIKYFYNIYLSFKMGKFDPKTVTVLLKNSISVLELIMTGNNNNNNIATYLYNDCKDDIYYFNIKSNMILVLM